MTPHIRNISHAFPYGTHEDITLGHKLAGVADLTMDVGSHVQTGYQFGASQVNNAVIGALDGIACLSLVTGPILIERGVRELRFSEVLKDWYGQLLAGLQIARGSLQSFAGATCILPSTVINIVLLFTACVVAATVSSLLARIGALIFAAASVLAIISTSIEIKVAWQCRSTIKNLPPKEALLELQKQLKDPVQGHLWLRSVEKELLKEVAEAKPEQAEEIITRLLKEQFNEIAVDAFTIFLSAAGIVLAILAMFTMSNLADLVLTILGAFLGFIWLVIDFKEVVEVFQK